jgi:cell division protein FtsN
MSKDYKLPEQKPRGSGSSLVLGIFIGLVLGLGIALGVAWYINKMPSPFIMRPAPTHPEPMKGAESAPPKGGEVAIRKTPEAKPRFDFYKMLPGAEESATEPKARETERKKPIAAPKEAFFLQAGSFQSAPDAAGLKARLALLGVEASVQATPLPDKGVWHRVRVGPYTSVEELARTRDTLKQNGVETTLIRVRE